MKAAFGLVALMVSVFILIWLFTMNTGAVVQVSQPAQKQAQRLASVDEDGVTVAQSIKVEPVERNGKVIALRVSELMIGGPMEKYYGLMKDDQILAVGQIDMKDFDADMDTALLMEARMRQHPLRIRRNGQIFTLLGADKEAELAAQGRPVSPPPGSGGGGSATDNRTAIQNQLNAIRQQQ